MEKIPFLDLAAQIKSLEPKLSEAIAEVVKSHAFIKGPALERFNKNFLKAHGGNYGVGCSNGTSAITVALRALGVQPGDEVLIPNNTFIATIEPVVELGATPVLVEVDEEFHQLDLEDAARKVTDKTKVIIPVHLYGVPEPMDDVMKFAREHGLKVVEDCAQAQLAKWKGQAVGTFGDIATFSFFPGKNLGAFGDAGYILTQSEELFNFVNRYIDHGRIDKYLHEFCGGNFRLDTIQAAILDVKLAKLEEWTDRRRELARAYDEQLLAKDFKVLTPRAGATPVYHLYVVQVSNREEVMAALKKQGIDTGIHYPVAMNAQPAMAPFGYKKGQFPISEKFSERCLSLPFFPEMTMAQMSRVVSEFCKVARP